MVRPVVNTILLCNFKSHVTQFKGSDSSEIKAENWKQKTKNK